MTTVVYRDGVLASESRVCCNGMIVPCTASKIYKLKDGDLYGFCGSLEIGEIIHRALMRGEVEERQDIRGDMYEGLLVTNQGDILYFENRCWTPFVCPYIALGSGKEYAYGAMALGASAAQAVEASISLDVNSCGRVHTIKLKGWEGKRSYVGRDYEGVTCPPDPKPNKKPATRKRKTAA